MQLHRNAVNTRRSLLAARTHSRGRSTRREAAFLLPGRGVEGQAAGHGVFVLSIGGSDGGTTRARTQTVVTAPDTWPEQLGPETPFLGRPNDAFDGCD
ncbi:hypothetical protein MRX96_013278 [Rhipicephalus microplus]